MARNMSGGPDTWRITGEERAKHDAQFFQQKPVNGFITGAQARGFFLQSGLPQQVLGQIWSLADMNGDGKMDRKEFSIAMFLIQKKLQGFELPKTLSPSLKADPTPAVGTFGATPMPVGGMPSMMPGFTPGAFPAPMATQVPMAASVPMATPMPNGVMMGQQTRGPVPGTATLPANFGSMGFQDQSKARTGSFNTMDTRSSASSGEWSVPHQSQLKYKQTFNMHDRTKRGYLMGVEARGVLMQSGLPQPVLAQIWNLSDIDKDGKLTSDEFVLCLHLADMAKSGTPLPPKLPPDLVPPSYRRGRTNSSHAVGLPPAMPSAAPVPLQPGPSQKDQFGDLLGGFGMPQQPPPTQSAQNGEAVQDVAAAMMNVTFEDKRKENFDKGQAELDRRRALLQEQQKKEQEARMMKERELAEKRERQRQEQERKKQYELEKQRQKQLELEREREEQRRKALEARESARREMERQRQLEWERQRKEQLIAEKARVQEEKDAMHSQNSKLKYELEASDAKRSEFGIKITQARSSVSDYTNHIDGMRENRDAKLKELDRLQGQLQNYSQKLRFLEQEKGKLNIQLQTAQQNNPLSDTYKTVMHSHSTKKSNIEKLKRQLQEIEKDTASRLANQDTVNAQYTEINNNFKDVHAENNRLYSRLQQKKMEWAEFKRKKVGAEMEKQNQEKKRQEQMQLELEAQRIKAEEERRAEEQRKREEEEAKKTEQSKSLFDAFKDFNSTPQQSQTSTTDAWANAFGNQNQTQQNDNWASAFNSSTTTTTQSTWGDAFGSSKTETVATKPGYTRYKAMYKFDARNPDELSLDTGDIVMIPDDQSGAEPGWMEGEKGGMRGWFPAAYVAKDESVASTPPSTQPTPTSHTAEVSPVVTSTDSGPSPDSGIASTTVTSNHVSSPVTSSTDTAAHLATSEESSFTAVQHSPETTETQNEVKQTEILKVQALYPWRAKKENHLTFNKNDIIHVKEQQDMWWSGELHGKKNKNDHKKKVGWFPKSYVKVIGTVKPDEDIKESPVAETPTPTEEDKLSVSGSANSGSASPSLERKGAAEDKIEEYYVAMYNYISGEPADLSFNQGEIITVTKKDGDWWTGTSGDKNGIFPANYVKKMETQEGIPTDTTETANEGTDSFQEDFQPSGLRSPPPTPGQKIGPKKPEIASVIAVYTATGAEQLSLQPGQLISVRKKSPSGWWEGELQARGQKRKIGWFPANYVKLLGSSSARNTPVTDSAKPGTPQPQAQTPTPTQPEIAAPAQETVEQVIAMYPYTAQNDDELTFQKDAVISVINKDDADWWKGELNGVQGVFPSNYVQSVSEHRADASPSPAPTAWCSDPDVIAATSETERKRQSYIHELITTEEAYMADMSIVMEVFYRPMADSHALNEQELASIFVNWKELIVCNTKLIKSLRVRKKMSGNGPIHLIGDILCENIQHLSPYIRFCSCQLNAAALIQHKTDHEPKFKEIAQKCCRDSRTKGMPLSSFLLKPMQRITRYPLMIKKILEYTPEDHPDHHHCLDALQAAEELCNQVNEGVREKENSDRLEWIQNHVQCEGLPEKITFNSVTNCLGPRKFLFSGTLYKVKSGKELVGFLFNDFLLLTQPLRPLGSVVSVFSFDPEGKTQYKMYKTPIFLNEIQVKIPQTPETDNCTFQVAHVDRMYNLKAVTQTEKESWMKKIESASSLYLETEIKKRERAYSFRQIRSAGVGRILVVILEGSNLKASKADVARLKRGWTGRLLVIVLEGHNLKASDDNVRRTPGVGRLLVVMAEGRDLCPSDPNGKSDPYCEVSMGSQEHKTKVICGTLNPKWNSSMQFNIKDIKEDVLCITVYDRDLFTPNDFLGRTEIRIADIMRENQEKKGPIQKRLPLFEVEKGEVVVKLDVHLFESN